MKFVPVSVIVKDGPRAVVVVGLMEVRVGTGLGAELTVKLTEFEVPPPGAAFVTVTGNEPVDATSLARIDAVTSVELTKVVVLGLLLNFTAELDTKPVPFTVSVSAPLPAVTPFGLSELIVGAGLLTVKVCAPVVPPPGAGLVTVTLIGPAVATSAAGTVT